MSGGWFPVVGLQQGRTDPSPRGNNPIESTECVFTSPCFIPFFRFAAYTFETAQTARPTAPACLWTTTCPAASSSRRPRRNRKIATRCRYCARCAGSGSKACFVTSRCRQKVCLLRSDTRLRYKNAFALRRAEPTTAARVASLEFSCLAQLLCSVFNL